MNSNESGSVLSTVRGQTAHGKPNARKRRSAQRPGKRERARVKNSGRGLAVYMHGEPATSLLGAGTVRVVAGRKKRERFNRWYADLRFPPDPSSGEPVKPESARSGGTAELLSRSTLIVGARHRKVKWQP